MLVLNRKVGQRIRLRLGDVDVWVAVVDVDQRGKVRLGIDAPLDVAVVREELLHGGPDNASVQ